MLPESDRGTMHCATPPMAWEPSLGAKQQTSAEGEGRLQSSAPDPLARAALLYEQGSGALSWDRFCAWNDYPSSKSRLLPTGVFFSTSLYACASAKSTYQQMLFSSCRYFLLVISARCHAEKKPSSETSERDANEQIFKIFVLIFHEYPVGASSCILPLPVFQGCFITPSQSVGWSRKGNASSERSRFAFCLGSDREEIIVSSVWPSLERL